MKPGYYIDFNLCLKGSKKYVQPMGPTYCGKSIADVHETIDYFKDYLVRKQDDRIMKNIVAFEVKSVKM